MENKKGNPVRRYSREFYETVESKINSLCISEKEKEQAGNFVFNIEELHLAIEDIHDMFEKMNVTELDEKEKMTDLFHQIVYEADIHIVWHVNDMKKGRIALMKKILKRLLKDI